MTRYRTIVADPPWPFQWDGRAGGRRRNSTGLGYATMPYPEIEALAVEALADDNATLFLWVTQEAMHAGIGAATAQAWGFAQRAGEFIWRKPNFGTGAFPRIGHETCLVYRRGGGSLKPNAPRDVHSVQTWQQPRVRGNGGKQHSAKPDGFYDLVEQGHDGPYAELFARQGTLRLDVCHRRPGPRRGGRMTSRTLTARLDAGSETRLFGHRRGRRRARYCEAAERKASMPTLFDAVDTPAEEAA